MMEGFWGRYDALRRRTLYAMKGRNPFSGTVKSFMKNATAYGTTEHTEKDSVSSTKKIKRQRLAGWEIDSLVEGEAGLGG
jgi:hypothetical protein